MMRSRVFILLITLSTSFLIVVAAIYVSNTYGNSSEVEEGVGLLPIPPPATGHKQSTPHGSDSYLVWEDSLVDTGSGAQLLDKYNIVGLDLQTKKTLLVTEAACDQHNPQVS